MTEEEAQAQIERMTDYATVPALDSDDIADLLNTAARVDTDGYDRSDAEWTPSWDLNAAAAEGWLRKAGKAASSYSFAEDGQRFERAQMYQHCLRQHELYSRTAMSSVQAETTLSD